MKGSRSTLFFLILGLVASGILLVAADFGESSANLGQITDEFDTSDNVSVTVDVVRNATLNAMQLNGTTGGPVYMDLTTFTEVDPGNDFTVTALRNAWLNMPRNVNNYLYYDFGAGNILDFYYEFNFSLSNVEAGDASNAGISSQMSVSNVLGNVITMRANDVIMVYAYQNAAVDDVFKIQFIEYSGGALQNAVPTGNLGLGIRYLILSRVGTFCKLEIYSDPAHTVLTHNQTFTATGGDNYRYFQAGASFGGASDPNDHSTGYIEYVFNGTGGGVGFASEGYFTTTDQLSGINGSVLAQLTNATIPSGTGITAEFSVDNSTWVNPTALTAGFMSIDLRDLNWSAAHHVRYNLTSTGSETPLLYQSRLITTEGPAGAAGPGAPGQNVSSEWVTYNLTEIGVTVGTLDSGDLNSTLDIDGDMFNVSELVGAPGMQISGNFSGVDPDADCLWVVIYAYYDGNLNHDFDIEVWNFTSSAWVEDDHITDGTKLEWFNSTIYALRIPNEFLSGGEVRVRLDHEAPGNINHDLFIEYFKLVAEIPAGPTPGAGAVTVTIVESDFPWIAIAIILMCVAYLLLRPK